MNERRKAEITIHGELALKELREALSRMTYQMRPFDDERNDVGRRLAYHLDVIEREIQAWKRLYPDMT